MGRLGTAPPPFVFQIVSSVSIRAFSLVPGQYKVCCLLCSPSLRSSASGFPLLSSVPAGLSCAELLGKPCWRARRSLNPPSLLRYVCSFLRPHFMASWNLGLISLEVGVTGAILRTQRCQPI